MRQASRRVVAGVALMSAFPALAQEAPIARGIQDNGKAVIEILSLARTEGDTVTLRLALVNENNRDMSLVLGNMRLIDLTNRRRYEPGLDSGGCRADAGQRRVCWAIFAAPPPGVKSINVKFYEDFPLISVPLGQ